ncbi:hypothetical protein HMPREF0766_14299 [Sphingobacterium spiritivorum ATCC 33861]|uniref:Uncharacterized protein n=1 Tax=Sphingobacterium spiritivorum ATCC 33861 TaxID=525373 RepID=D7VTJ5_SPHSI|nr:hypothetical protein HMPREF0766_14299 [Sphingobacterium spiritivorum ATCC 33861]
MKLDKLYVKCNKCYCFAASADCPLHVNKNNFESWYKSQFIPDLDFG